MAIEFCPLADEVGNLADWVAVGVGTVGAIATTVVAVLAYLTSNRATDIADEAKKIAQQQHDQTVELQVNIARILGSLLQVEVVTLPIRLGAVLRDFDAAVEPITRHGIVGDTKFSAVIGDLTAGFLPAAEGAFDQIHNLPEELGAHLASMMGMTRNIGVTARKVDSRMLRVSDMSGGYDIVGYKGEGRGLGALRAQIVSMLRSSLGLAESFNVFVKGELLDYSEERALIKE